MLRGIYETQAGHLSRQIEQTTDAQGSRLGEMAARRLRDFSRGVQGLRMAGEVPVFMPAVIDLERRVDRLKSRFSGASCGVESAGRPPF